MVSRRQFIRIAATTGVLAASGSLLAACSGGRGTDSATGAATNTAQGNGSNGAPTGTQPAASSALESAAASIVVYFSHTGENYGVGIIEEGNTAIIARMIAEETGADTFEIVPEKTYPDGYRECCDVALEEQRIGSRPAYVGNIDLAKYSTVYLGYPIWWSDLPMCVYAFLEAHEWAGKEIHPFATHAGSGLANTVSTLRTVCTDASVADGLAITGTAAQNSRDEARTAVHAWLG